jgi:hypothetical protein
MTMLTKENEDLIKNQLSEALVKFSDQKMSISDAQNLADIVLRYVDFSNSSLSHKGINWYAKHLLKKIEF